jgi:hypothetical protein
MKGALYDSRNGVQAREEVILQSKSQELLKESIDRQHASEAFIISTGQVLYGYSVDGSRIPKRHKAKNRV